MGRLPRIYIYSKKNKCYVTDVPAFTTEDLDAAISFSFFSIKKYLHLSRTRAIWKGNIEDWKFRRIQIMKSRVNLRGGMKL